VKSNRTFDKGIIFLILIVLIIGGTVFFFYSRMKTDRMADALSQEETVTMAFLITDQESGLLATEIFFYHPGTKKGALLDIPDNTGDIVASVQRIDSISILFEKDNPEPYVAKLEEIIDQPIPFYFEMNLEQLVSLVDLNGGLEIFIANPVEIPEEMVFLPSGSLVLDGDKAATYITYTEEGELELERTDRREKFVNALLKGWGTEGERLLVPEVFDLVYGHLKTNLTRQGLETLIGEIRAMDTERMVFQRVLGVEREVDGKTLLFRHKDGLLLKEMVRQTMKSLANMDVVSDEELGATLEILNGTNNTGLATRTGQLFQSFGYDVASVGNSDSFDREFTVVIDRSGDVNRAQRVASVIKCTRIERQVAESINEEGIIDQTVDVTIILGKDFDGRYCKE